MALTFTFMGYRRPDGRAGVRNHVLILSAVTCANTVVDKIGRRLGDAVVTVAHAAGCGQGGADLAQTRRTLLGTAGHPNVGAVLVVGLGCETLDTRRLAAEAAELGKPAYCLLIQEAGGTTATVEAGAALAVELLATVRGTLRQPIDCAELIVGLECGASDGFSGVTANPVAGAAADRLVAAGGTVILSEVTEFIGAEHILAGRARDAATAARLLDCIERREREAAQAGVDLAGAQINPGNLEGGLTTPEEKSLGAITKGGTSRLEGVVAYAERPSRRGLVVMDTPGDDVESLTGMVAGGAQLAVFTTGRGTPCGHAIAPVIKVGSNTALLRRMGEHIDLDAGAILEGRAGIEEMGARLFEEMRAVAGGKATRAELLGQREFAISIIGPRQ